MYLTIQLDTIAELPEAISCNCSEIRIGSEFCENKILPTQILLPALGKVASAGKKVSLIYPRISAAKIGAIREQLDELAARTQELDIVANDMGIVSYIVAKNLHNLHVALGRQLIASPKRAKPPMPKIMGKENLLSKFVDRRLFDTTNLNYGLTIEYLKKLGVAGMEFDYLPDTFEQLNLFARKGFRVGVHLGNAFVALTRKCHTARYFGQPYNSCGRRCATERLCLDNEVVGKLFLHGNVLLDYRAVEKTDLAKLKDRKKMNFVVERHWTESPIHTEQLGFPQFLEAMLRRLEPTQNHSGGA